jgi:hypothetical protein
VAEIKEMVVFHSTYDELRSHVEELPSAAVGDPDQPLYREFGVRSSSQEASEQT